MRKCQVIFERALNANAAYMHWQPCTAANIIKAYLNQTRALHRKNDLDVTEKLYSVGSALLDTLLESLPEGQKCSIDGGGDSGEGDSGDSPSEPVPDGNTPVAFSSSGSFGGFGSDPGNLDGACIGINAEPGKFQYPQGMNLGINNEIHVVDDTNRRIQVFDKDTFEFKRQYGECMFYPNDVAVDAQGNSYVAEYGAWIHVFDSDGNLTNKFSTEPSGARSWPWGIFVDERTGYIIVAGAPTENSRISVWTPEGDLVKFWPAASVFDVWVDFSGTIYAATWRKILRFDIDGNLLGEFAIGYGAVAITGDNRGHLFVTFYYDNRVDVYSSNGNLMGIFALPEGLTPPQPYSGHIYGLAYDPDGYLFVTDRVNHSVLRIAVFTP